MEKQKAKLINWSITVYNQFQPPELQQLILQGNVYNHPKIKDGIHVITSRLLVLDIRNNMAETKNTIYELDEINQEYIKFLKENYLEFYKKIFEEKIILEHDLEK